MSAVQDNGAPSSVSAAAGSARPLARGSSGWRWLPLSVVVIVLDQAVKAWMVHHFTPFERVRVLSVLDIILAYNTGAAFSFLSDAAGWQRWLFVVLALAVSAVLIGWMRRLRAPPQSLLASGLALIVGGAIGNMIDRLTFGRVVDFIHVHAGNAYFPAFNVADSAITVGAGLLLLDAWLEGRRTRQGDL
jgi:signal peptidase II